MEKKLIAVAVSSALGLPLAAHAVEGSVSGHVNRAIISVDDGSDANDGSLRHVDSNASETRFRFTGSEDLGNGMTAGVQLELGRPSNWRTRHANVSLSGSFGKLTIGQASAATDGVAHADLGGASWLGGVTNWCSYASSGPACPSNDGNRLEVLRYDTPAIGPASVAASISNDDYLDAKVSIAGSMGGGYGYDLRVGHTVEYGDDMDPSGDIITASAAASFGQGTSVAVAWSQENTGSQIEYQYLKLDHSYGDGSVGAYYKLGESGDTGAEGTVLGVGVGHGLGGGATAYAGYRQITEDDQEDVSLILAGMRVTFN